ncbi:hypothetical protein SEA_ATUIN_319 [Arthrobacter phage Atuin]|nr:hypothetical protein SEA_ATUIN_118 [Arthrobacter phage Atuin]
MTAPTITAIRENTEDATLGVLPYEIEIRGQFEPSVKVVRTMDLETGSMSVSVQTPVADGKPLLSLSAMDQVARRILPGARVLMSSKAHGAVKRRIYAADSH